jgi:hypothetical protein
MSVLVGGVGELFQGDLDVGRRAVDRLLHEPLPRPGRTSGPGSDPAFEVLVEELHYGAVAVAQRLEEVAPTTLVLLGAVRRDRPAGTVERRRIEVPALTTEQMQAAVGDAVTGYVGLDLVVEVAGGFGVLPPRTVTFELEPESVLPGDALSVSASRGLETMLELVRQELDRLPLLDLAATLRTCHGREAGGGSPAGRAMNGLLEELHVVDREGRWGSVFSRRDQLRLAIARGETAAAMDRRDWGLWWAMLEELDRLQALEAGPPG